MLRKILFILSFFAVCTAALTAGAEAERGIAGSWRLDRVYESAHSQNPAELDPENAASVYAEKNDINTFKDENNRAFFTTNAPDGSFTETGTWEKDGDRYTVRYDDGTFELIFFYDEENDTLHRYWAETAADAMYHDLDFVYIRVPAGVWQLSSVISTEPGKDPEVLDPESSASIYAEQENLYCLNDDLSAEVRIIDHSSDPDTVIVYKGRWSQNEDSVLFDVVDYETEFVYDREKDQLHRFWKDVSADGPAPDLDFVYVRLP